MQADQEATLTRLFRATRANRLEFLLEIIPSKVAPTSDTTAATLIDRFYALGIYPDWWKLEPMTSDAAWANATAAIARHDPFCRGIIVLGLDAPTEDLAAELRRRRPPPAGEGLRHRPHHLRRHRPPLARRQHHRRRRHRRDGRGNTTASAASGTRRATRKGDAA